MLIDANALLLTDIPVGERFTTGIHMRSYTFDAKNSSFEALQQHAGPVVVRRLRALPEPAGDAAAGADAATPPPNPFPPFTTLPDGRSLFLGYTYNFAKLPEPMAARRADPRVGHFDSRGLGFLDRHEVHRQDALRQSLAPREEGPGGGAVRAEGADRLLDRPHRPREVPRRGARRHPRVEQGVREDRLQGRDRREAAGRRRRRSTPSTPATRRCAGSSRPTPVSRSARPRSIRAPARS